VIQILDSKEGTMTELSSKFSREDVETLIAAVGDWELVGNQEFHMMQMIRNAPMPPEDHEAYEPMSQIKEWYRNREKKILDGRELRQERAVFLKAKLMLVRRDMQISQLFEMANEPPQAGSPQAGSPQAGSPQAESPPQAKAPPQVVPTPAPETLPSAEGTNSPLDAQQKLDLAEFFIKDLGVWEHYLKFLQERHSEKHSEE